MSRNYPRNKVLLYLAPVLCVIAAAVFVYTSHHQLAVKSPNHVSLRLPIPIVEAGSAPFFVAVDKGFYRDEGLDVDIRMGSKELNPVKMVATGTDTFGVLGGPDTLLVARSNGAPLTAIMILHRNANLSVVISLVSSKISKVEDLRDKKIGFYYGHISTDILRDLFRSQHVPIKEVDVGFDYSPLINKQVAASWGFRTTAGLDLPAQGIQINMINPVDYGIVSHGYTVFAKDQTLSANPDIVERFTIATLRGIRYTVDHPEDANQSLLKRDPNLDPALSLKRLLLYNAVMSSTPAYPPGYMDSQMFQETYDRLKAVGVITKEFDPKTAFTKQFTQAAYRQPGILASATQP